MLTLTLTNAEAGQLHAALKDRARALLHFVGKPGCELASTELALTQALAVTLDEHLYPDFQP